jgi:hypothetical protein
MSLSDSEISNHDGKVNTKDSEGETFAVDSGNCSKRSPTQQNRILGQGEVNTKDSEEDTDASEKRLMKRKSEETNLPQKGKRKKKACKSSTSSENDYLGELISLSDSEISKHNALLKDEAHFVSNSGNNKGASQRVKWTSKQELDLKSIFHEHLAQKIYPSGIQINLRKRNSSFESRSNAQFKSKLHFMMKKAT